MKLSSTEIPAKFLKQDSTISDADAFQNVRELRRLKTNYNILLARRTRRCILSKVFCYTTAGAPEDNPVFDEFKYDLAGSPALNRALFEVPIYVSQGCQSIQIYFYACKSVLNVGSTLDFDPKIYFRLHNPQMKKDITSTSVITITDAHPTFAAYNAKVEIPHTKDEAFLHGKEEYLLGAYPKFQIDDTLELDSAVAITDFGSNYVTTAAGALSAKPGDVLHFDSDGGKEPRMITRVYDFAGMSKYYVQKDFNQLPETTDTIATTEIQGIYINSISVYENAITDFSLDPTGDY
jgi:hypothetical protein